MYSIENIASQKNIEAFQQRQDLCIFFIPYLKVLYVNLKKRRITTELLKVIGILSFIITGRIFLTSLIAFLGLLNLKLLAQTEAHSQRQLTDIFNQKQQLVWVQKSGTEIEIPLEEVKQQDIVIVNAGEVIPVDGIVVQGLASVDQQTLTGESQPLEKEIADRVFASTLVLSGWLLIKVEHSGSETSATKIADILLQTQEYKEDLRLRGKHIADSFIAPALVFDKTGTLTMAQPRVSQLHPLQSFGEETLLTYAAAEYRQTHPIAHSLKNWV